MSCLSRISDKIHVPCSPIIKQTQNFWANCSKTVKVAAVAAGLFGASAAVYFGIKGPVFWSAQKILQVIGVGVATAVGLRFMNNLYPQAAQKGIQFIAGKLCLRSSAQNEPQPAAQVFGEINIGQNPFGFVRSFSSDSKDSYTKQEVESNLLDSLKRNGKTYEAENFFVQYWLKREPKECFIFNLNGVQEKLIIRLYKDPYSFDERAVLTDANQSFAKLYFDCNSDVRELFEYNGRVISKREQQFCWHAGPNSYEHIDYVTLQSKLEGPEFWDQWKEICPDANSNYVNSIYPSVLDSLSSLIKKNSVIVEIAGGDGVFAERVLTSSQGEKISEYHLIDLNEVSLEKARARKIEKMTVTKGDITKPFLSDKKEKVDLVIGVGALTTQVLPSYQSAIEGLRQARSILKKGGHLILSGHAKTFISSIDLEKEGFLVKQVYDPKRKIYLYVAQKKD